MSCSNPGFGTAILCPSLQMVVYSSGNPIRCPVSCSATQGSASAYQLPESRLMVTEVPSPGITVIVFVFATPGPPAVTVVVTLYCPNWPVQACSIDWFHTAVGADAASGPT